MAKLQEKVTGILSRAFPDPAIVNVAQASWGTDEANDPESGRIIAIVISDAFEGVDHLDRQRLVWGPLEGALTPSERSKIGIIVPSTSAEQEFAEAVGGS